MWHVHTTGLVSQLRGSGQAGLISRITVVRLLEYRSVFNIAIGAGRSPLLCPPGKSGLESSIAQRCPGMAPIAATTWLMRTRRDGP